MKLQVLLNQTTNLPELKISYNADAPTNDERLLELFVANLALAGKKVVSVSSTTNGVETVTFSVVDVVVVP